MVKDGIPGTGIPYTSATQEKHPWESTSEKKSASSDSA